MEQDSFDIRNVAQAAIRYWWLLFLLCAMGAGGAFYLTSTAIPIYEATSRILVRGGQSAGGLSTSDLTNARELAGEVQDLITTRSNMQNVVGQLDANMDAATLRGKLTVSTRRSIISIVATDTDPLFAADIANTTSSVFIDDFLRRQLTQIAQFQAAVSQFDIGDQSSFIGAQATALGSLTLIEEAIAPRGPSRRPIQRNAILGGLLGIIAASMLVFLLEILSNKFRSPDELKESTGVAVLGTIPLQRDSRSSLITNAESHSSINEPYRFLRAGLEFSSIDLPACPAFLVTSALPGEGKTTTAINLCLSAANEGKRVILVDADLRLPTVASSLGLQGQVGLTNLLVRNMTVSDALTHTDDEDFIVLASGPPPPDAAQVLHSDRFREVLDELRKLADLVVVDSPPVLSVVDPLLLVPEVDGVIMIVEAGKTRRDAVRRAINLLKDASPKSLSAVFNKVGQRSKSYYYYRYYNESRNKPGSWRQRLLKRVPGLRGRAI